jgi:DNA modification methylase
MGKVVAKNASETEAREQVADQTIPKALPSEKFLLRLGDAAELAGVTEERLVWLARRKKILYEGSHNRPLVPVTEALRLREGLTSQRPAPSIAASANRVRKAVAQDTVVEGNVMDVLEGMPDGSVQCVVTSPPFWGQRVYEDEKPVSWSDGTSVAYGREATPEAYLAHTLEVIRALSRVLKPRGTIWWNVGDTYMTRSIARASSFERVQHYGGVRTRWANNPNRRFSSGHSYLKDKDLTLVPFQVAMGCQQMGLWVRAVIVWSKQHSASAKGGEAWSDSSRAHVPEVVMDRPVTGHEYVLLIAKREVYDYYPDALTTLNGHAPPGDRTTLNFRSVWTFPPATNDGTHGARFPLELPRRCIALGSKKGDLIFDCFSGEGTTLMAARSLGRHYYGSDISPTYVAKARRRLAQQELVLSQATPNGKRKAGRRVRSPKRTG